jgi:hypothetical protein
MTATHEIPHFAAEPWYRDPSDHRCPHDSWLDSIEISEPAQGQRHERRTTYITIRLLGAYHDGHILFRYSDVRSYSIVAGDCAHGLRDWLSDSFAASGESIVHDIAWSGASDGEQAHWRIEARDVQFEWIPCV